MAESSPKTQPKKTDTDKNPPETVQLTAEELKAIAGGATPGKPPVTSQSVTNIKKPLG